MTIRPDILRHLGRATVPLLTIALAVLGLVAVKGDKAFDGRQQTVTVDARTRNQQKLALSSDGLRAAAAVTGTFVGHSAYSTTGEVRDIGELFDLSHIVVVGQTISNRCVPTADDRSIATWHEVLVNEVVKGDLFAGASLTVAIPGGKVSFDDGSWAQINAIDLLGPDQGRRYVWFLRRAAATDYDRLAQADQQMFELARGGLGLYDLTPADGKMKIVIPAGKVRSSVGMSIARRRLGGDAFLAEVRKLVQEGRPLEEKVR